MSLSACLERKLVSPSRRTRQSPVSCIVYVKIQVFNKHFTGKQDLLSSQQYFGEIS